MNAIILAAGLGSRFGYITKNNHKALLPIGGTPNIERTIKYLHEFGVTEIHIVTGHMSHLFEVLKNKYHCNLIYNNRYNEYNNIYSLYCAQKYFTDTLVIDADVVLLENIFLISDHSHYYVIQRKKSKNKEWVVCTTDEGIVDKILVTNKYKPSLLGVSYWIKEDCQLIKQKLLCYLQDEKHLINQKLYWDHIPISILQTLKVKAFLIHKTAAAEMDNMDNYHRICTQLASVN
ncbi:NTP transferase domain-containing protein [Candidatus Fukatsuia symbiotica]|uniref:MobA-like NTP transferase domain-containing protein n=1 Tax=Candidatus Fukatsuia symbiotica TaxID=1878942 RepID=A0A2U8I2J9_9GAMM|nr:NTP transferase domain-containing protein [Candidatus Fukatsuia symbiotica]AWK13332.1 hypothetical protein CCS41_00605 [Candidatus Fukatsuia symbiotica]MEA9444210.1 NTP transferase domain-containing protein [Candidatus Fukatsuia symbiotica]